MSTLPAFNISFRRVGGLRFVRIGRLSFSYCVTAKPVITSNPHDLNRQLNAWVAEGRRARRRGRNARRVATAAAIIAAVSSPANAADISVCLWGKPAVQISRMPSADAARDALYIRFSKGEPFFVTIPRGETLKTRCS